MLTKYKFKQQDVNMYPQILSQVNYQFHLYRLLSMSLLQKMFSVSLQWADMFKIYNTRANKSISFFIKNDKKSQLKMFKELDNKQQRLL